MKRYSVHEDRQLAALVGVKADSVWATVPCGFWCHVWMKYEDGSEFCTESKHFGANAAAVLWGRRMVA
jgi:hypothetical protein